jgi:hypothetical protein
MVLRIILFWLPMPVIAIFNAAIREKLLSLFLDELRSHQISTLLLIMWISLYGWIIFPYLKIQLPGDAWTTGFIWLVLTILFEFIAGRYAFKNPWTRLLADYNLARGRVWIIFLLYLAILPYLLYSVQNG